MDDDREIVQAIALLLEKEGYRVLRAYNGLEALELACERSVQLILLDVMMPRLDGLSALMKIREKRNPPIIAPPRVEDSDKILGLSMGRTTMRPSPTIPKSCWSGSAVSCVGIPGWGRPCGRAERRDRQRPSYLFAGGAGASGGWRTGPTPPLLRPASWIC